MMVDDDELAVVQRHMRNPPVDPEAIIRELGISFEKADFAPNDSGYIRRRQGGQYAITVNGNEGIQRRRFTAAHELAHYLLHRDLLDEHGHLDRLYSEGANPSAPLTLAHEVQANKLAAQILMPSSQVKRLAATETPEELAKRFRVSPAAMKIRLKTLGLAA